MIDMKVMGYVFAFVAAVVLSVFAVESSSILKGGGKEDGEGVDQSSVCVAYSDEQALGCPEGELFMAWLSPIEDGESKVDVETRLLNTVALYCDMNYTVQHTKSGVICVLTHERTSAQELKKTDSSIE
ncbi:hypothetical protein [Guyparkeria sp.]|uniref:hypothetical protein n=1 Tax=Guyparkeria sp. TaxID=2035736 RepID=UPI003971153B